MARHATEVIGGPTGSYAAIGRRGWTYAGAILSALASVVVALGVVQKNHCIRFGWSTPGSLWHACYSDLAVGTTGNPGASPWVQGGVGDQQPALTALLTWGLQHLVPDGSVLSQERIYFAIGAAVIALCIGLTVIATAVLVRDTPWLAAHIALSPVLITAALVSFDMFGVLLATLALLAWSRRNPGLAGLLFGAAIMARSYPAIIVAAIALLTLRDRRFDELGRLLIGVVVALAVVLGLAFAMGGDPLSVYGKWNDQGASYGSPWLLAQIMHIDIPAHGLTVIAIIGWIAAILVGIFLVTRPTAPTRLAPLALTMLVIVMITGKAMSVQSCLWVLPLIALAGMRWREHLIWAGVEMTYFVMTWMYAGLASNPGKALPAAGYAIFLAVRLIAYVGLAWTSWETADEMDDPLYSAPRGPARRDVPPASRFMIAD